MKHGRQEMNGRTHRKEADTVQKSKTLKKKLHVYLKFLLKAHNPFPHKSMLLISVTALQILG